MTIKAIMNPAIPDVLKNLKTDIFRNLNCVKIGIIKSFDGTKKTATIQIIFKRVKDNGQTQSYPILVDCPVVTIQGGGAALQMPIAAEDQCLVLFSDRNIDAWYKLGSEAAPFDDRCHDLSDGIAIVGVNALTSTLPNYAANTVSLNYGSAKITIDNAGVIKIQNSATTIQVAADGTLSIAGGPAIELLGTSLLALKADADAISTFLTTFLVAYNAHTHGSVPLDTPFASPPPVATGTTKLKAS